MQRSIRGESPALLRSLACPMAFTRESSTCEYAWLTVETDLYDRALRLRALFASPSRSDPPSSMTFNGPIHLERGQYDQSVELMNEIVCSKHHRCSRNRKLDGKTPRELLLQARLLERSPFSAVKPNVL